MATRTCGARDQKISQAEAIEIATKQVDFVPCSQPGCVQIRFLQRGIPIRAFWLVGLRSTLDDASPDLRVASLLVDVETGEVSQP